MTFSVTYCIQEKHYGVIDENKKTIIPFEYKEINIQSNGIVVKDDDDNIGCYTLNGVPIFLPSSQPSQPKINDVIFLKDQRLILRITETEDRTKKECEKLVLMNFSCNTLIPFMFDSILIFTGSNYHTIEISSKFAPSEEILDSNAYIENKVCIKACMNEESCWGVFNLTTKKIIHPFKYSEAKQSIGSHIVLTDNNGEKVKL